MAEFFFRLCVQTRSSHPPSIQQHGEVGWVQTDRCLVRSVQVSTVGAEGARGIRTELCAFHGAGSPEARSFIHQASTTFLQQAQSVRVVATWARSVYPQPKCCLVCGCVDCVPFSLTLVAGFKFQTRRFNFCWKSSVKKRDHEPRVCWCGLSLTTLQAYTHNQLTPWACGKKV